MGSTNSTAQCTLFDNQDLCDTVIIVKRVAASISLLGCLLTLTNIIVYKKYSNFVQRIILYMTIAAMLSAIAYVMGDLQEDGPFCTFQGFVTNLADWALLMWIFLITVTLYVGLVKDIKLGNREWAYHIVCWGIPIIASCIPFIDDNHYGPSGAWCWIDSTVWRFGSWYIPLFTLLIVMVILNSHMVYTVHRRAKQSSGIYSPENELTQRRKIEEVKPLRAYPFLYLLLNIFPLINRIQNAVDDNAVFVLTLFHAISVSSQGTLNAAVFGLNKQTLSEFRWSNFKLQARSLCINQRSIITDYEVENDDHPIVDVSDHQD